MFLTADAMLIILGLSLCCSYCAVSHCCCLLLCLVLSGSEVYKNIFLVLGGLGLPWWLSSKEST